jgi:outer membrane protein assembly factor BamB
MNLRLIALISVLAWGGAASLQIVASQDWLTWRGPTQNNVSTGKGFPERIRAENTLWTADLPGQSTPVIHQGRLYINGFLGDGPDLQEVLACFDATTGEKLWSHRENDFLSDIIYKRYATSSPSVDAETGNVYSQFTQGIFAAFDRDGKMLWRRSMMEEFGRLTFPNARTGSPLVDQDLVITRGVTSAWGAHGPAGDRFYAFDKLTGDLVWSASPAGRPQDNTFSHPYLDFWQGQRVLYSSAGDSSILALNVRNGEPLWRFAFAKSGAKGGINASVARYKDQIIAIHESENLDSSEIGRMASFKLPSEVNPPSPMAPEVLEGKDLETWRNGLGTLASSPVVVDDLIYVVTGVGDLAAVDAETGEVLWKKKLGIEQRQSTPFYANGLLYVGVYISAEGAEAAQTASGEAGSNGDLFVLRPSRNGCEELSRTQLVGRCFGSPMGVNGRIYVQTDKRLYCFGSSEPASSLVTTVVATESEEKWPEPGAPAALQIIPYEIILSPGQTQSFRIRTIDAKGIVVNKAIEPKTVKWEPFIPPTALVRVQMSAEFNAAGELVANKEQGASAGQFKATYKTADGKEIVGYIKGRILPDLPVVFDFEEFQLTNTTTNSVEPPTAFAYPPLPWNGARVRFEVRDAPMDDKPNKALVKTIENKLFQRAQVFFGRPEMKNYTIEADVMSEGTSRKMSEVGLINQRYLIIMKGNSRQIEINSNQERIKEAVSFRWTPNTWYRLKTRVDVAEDGSGVVRAKAWKRGDPEPDEWTIEVAHQLAHANGSPGVFGFVPQDQRIAIDNIRVTPN